MSLKFEHPDYLLTSHMLLFFLRDYNLELNAKRFMLEKRKIKKYIFKKVLDN